MELPVKVVCVAYGLICLVAQVQPDNDVARVAQPLNVTDETRLINVIMENYNSASRPVYNASHTVTVKFGITLTQISDMDEVNQVLTMNVWLEQEWDDERLVWDPKDYNNLKILRLPCELLWLPDIVLYNSADDYTNGYMNSKAMVHHNGTVFWAPPARFRCSCKIDITYFPFDDQSCELQFGSWTYDGFQVDLTNRTPDVNLENYVYSGEWELIGARIKRTVAHYACCIEPYPDVRFTVVIRRKTLYYLFNIIFPCLWLTILSLLGFWLPPDSGEKITLGITVLLAFSVFMLLIAESMPATSEFVPLMGIYLTMTMGMTSMSIILTVFVLQLHHVGPHKQPVPQWLWTLTIDVLSCLVCTSRDSQHYRSRRLSPEALPNQGAARRGNASTSPASNCLLSSGLRDDDGSPVDLRSIEVDSRQYARQGNAGWSTYTQHPGHDRTRNKSHSSCNGDETGLLQRVDAPHVTGDVWTPRSDISACRLLPQPASHDAMSRHVTQHTPVHIPFTPSHEYHAPLNPPDCLQSDQEEDNQEERHERIVQEWQFVAHVMDRVLFWLFLFVAIACSVAILVIKPMYKPTSNETVILP